MALIKCTECGKEISDKAVACPNCGCPVGEILKDTKRTNSYSTFEANKYHKREDSAVDNADKILLAKLRKQYPDYPTYAADVYASEKGISKAEAKKIVADYYRSAPPVKFQNYHQKQNSNGCLIVFLTVIAVFVLFIVMVGFIVGLSKNDDEVKNVTSENVTSENTSSGFDSNSEDKEVDSITKNDTAFSVGEVAEYKDVQVSVVSYSESAGNEWGKPAKGNKFIFVEIEIINNSDEEISISSMMSFECYCDDYKLDYSSNAFMVVSTTDNMKQLDGSIASGKKMKGTLGIEVPETWETIEIYYNDNVWFGSNFSFIITK